MGEVRCRPPPRQRRIPHLRGGGRTKPGGRTARTRCGAQPSERSAVVDRRGNMSACEERQRACTKRQFRPPSSGTWRGLGRSVRRSLAIPEDPTEDAHQEERRRQTCEYRHQFPFMSISVIGFIGCLQHGVSGLVRVQARVHED